MSFAGRLLGFGRSLLDRQEAAAVCDHRERERRIMCQSLTLWENARLDSAPAPCLAAIDLAHPQVGPHFYVLRTEAANDRFVNSTVEHCGGTLSEFCGLPAVGKSIGEVFPRAIGEEMVEFLRAALRLGKPMAESGGYLCGNGDEVLFRDAIMPLLPENGVQRLLGAISYCRIPAGGREDQRRPAGRPLVPTPLKA
jgi:hypothetical protein